MYQQLPDFNGQPAQAIKRIADGATIPFDPANTDYQAYLAWVAVGNAPEPVPVPGPPPVPQVVSRFQARAALHLSNLLVQVEALIAQADPLTQMAWADATEFKRKSPAIDGLGHMLGLTEEQKDDLFRLAATIET